MQSIQKFNSVTSCLYYCPFPVQGTCKLEVTGIGKVMAKPDTAEAVIGVITENMQLEAAQKENAVKMSSVIQAIKQQGIPSEAIQTQTYNIEPMYDYIDGKQVFRGYRVTHNIKVTIKNMDMVGKVIDSAVNAGANYVTGISFTVANPEAYYKAALTAAVDDAAAKASAIGNKLNVQVFGIPVQILEVTYQQIPPVQPYQMQTTAAATVVQPGQIEITAVIKTIFAYRT